MSEILIILVALVVLANSCLMLATNTVSYDSVAEKYPIVKLALMVTFVALFVIIPWQLGAVARVETSAIPWEVWELESRRHGNLNGMLAVIINVVFLLWVFLLPGHLFANSLLKKKGTRPAYPYVINILTGIILCIPANPVYKILRLLA